MTGRGRVAEVTNDLLERMTQVLEALVHNQDGEPAKYRGLSAFTRHNPPKFEGKFDLKEPRGGWLMWRRSSMQWIDGVASQTLPYEDDYIKWETFKASLLGNYFPRNLKKQKAREFLELKQGNMTVEEYAATFQELMKYWPHYQHEDGEEDLCAQFKHGLRPEIRAD
ncbi:uncharacterized protein LOC113874235 [Abrus precatorius]|uniref:Uncharacterized protein LOC113874234 n=1 Tax=Abrus precatorius TaxID=3816 RepID=A0A8B8MK36_ABRPR|nr:uncharacterized protein LOC113874234 [Abrus precatorius]XP_027368269.1 uncharacterized protein LOC113874235 [Abrus precatorius]